MTDTPEQRPFTVAALIEALQGLPPDLLVATTDETWADELAYSAALEPADSHNAPDGIPDHNTHYIRIY